MAKKKKIVVEGAEQVNNGHNEKEVQVEELAQEEITQETTEDNKGEEQTATIEKLEKELKEWKDKNLRLLAEFDNLRRRTAREQLILRKTASEDVVKDLLPILDDFERAFKAAGDTKEEDKDGFQLIYNKFRKTLETKGLKEMDATGQAFDTEFHEALTEIPAPSKELKGKVIEEIEKGYYLHEKIIRYAKVIVGK